MSRKLTIQVTQDDIARGERNRCDRCPLARAIRRATGLRVSVAATSVRLTDPQLRRTEHLIQLPREAVWWRTDFDAGRPVAPFSFDLESA